MGWIQMIFVENVTAFYPPKADYGPAISRRPKCHGPAGTCSCGERLKNMCIVPILAIRDLPGRRRVKLSRRA